MSSASVTWHGAHLSGRDECEACGLKACQLTEGQKMKWCGKCKSVTYCSLKCQKRHWAVHKEVCSVIDERPLKDVIKQSHTGRSQSSGCENPAPYKFHRGFDAPYWGGPLTSEEDPIQRLGRIVETKTDKPRGQCSQVEAFSKAQELFRLFMVLCMKDMSYTADLCTLAFTEAILLDEKAIPQGLTKIHSRHPEKSPMGIIMNELTHADPDLTLSGVRDFKLRLAFMQMFWLDMQVMASPALLQEASSGRSQLRHSTNMVTSVLSLDKLAREAVEHHMHDVGVDNRILSRLVLEQAQLRYPDGQLHSLLPPDSCTYESLLACAVSLWPEDIIARLHARRLEDCEALLGISGPGLLEKDSKQYGAVCYDFAWQVREQQPVLAQEYFLEGLRWEERPGNSNQLQLISQKACIKRNVMRKVFSCEL